MGGVFRKEEVVDKEVKVAGKGFGLGGERLGLVEVVLLVVEVDAFFIKGLKN